MLNTVSRSVFIQKSFEKKISQAKMSFIILMIQLVSYKPRIGGLNLNGKFSDISNFYLMKDKIWFFQIHIEIKREFSPKNNIFYELNIINLMSLARILTFDSITRKPNDIQ